MDFNVGDIIKINTRGKDHRYGILEYNGMKAKIIGATEGEEKIFIVNLLEEYAKKLVPGYKKYDVMIPDWAIETDRGVLTMEVE